MKPTLAFTGYLFTLLTHLLESNGQTNVVKIGFIIHQDFEDSTKLWSAIQYKMRKMGASTDRTWVQIQALEGTDYIFDTEDIVKLHKEVCKKVAEGAQALVFVGTAKSAAEMNSIAERISVPVLMPLSTKNQKTPSDFVVSLKPSLNKPIIEVIKKNGWNRVFYLFDSEEGLLRLQSFLEDIAEIQFVNEVIIESRRITNISDSYELLRTVDRQYLNCSSLYPCPCPRPIILDLSTQAAFNQTRKQIIDVGMNREQYHYILANLGADELDLSSFKYGGMNVTGFSIKDPTYEKNIQQSDCYSFSGLCPINHKHSLIMDTLEFLSRAVNSPGFTLNNHQSLPSSNSCDVSGLQKTYGRIFLRIIKGTKVKSPISTGTGTLALDAQGKRKDYMLEVKFFTFNSSKFEKVGIWQESGLSTKLDYCNPSKDPITRDNQTWIITTIVGEPFVQELKLKEGNAVAQQGVAMINGKLYEGFCIEVAEKIKERYERLEGKGPGTFNYKFKLVDDTNFGSPNRDNGTWNGMIGELLTGKADLALASLTITRARQRVVDFTKPFMKIGISIMIKKPDKQKPGVFSFMEPLDSMVWVCVSLAFTGVSLVLFFVGRWSPYEWRAEATRKEISVTNAFTLSNTLWFSLGALMQQGSDIFPRSISGRIVGSAWWFFTLILISSYTANLAAFLTIERLIPPIQGVEDLVKNKDVEYGTYKGGSTEAFFEMSQVPIYNQMYEYMKANEKKVMVKSDEEGYARVRQSKGDYAYLVESPKNDYQNQKKPCNTMKVGENLDHKGYGIATAPNSALRKDLNLVVLMLREEGELHKLQRKWWFDKGECGTMDSKDTSKNALTLSNVSGIFHILIGGLVLSMLVSLVEYSVHRLRKQHKLRFQKQTDAPRPAIKIEKKHPLEVLKAAGYTGICDEANAYIFNPPEQLTTFESGKNTEL
ncbi:glutamate receptor 2-like [Saccostrea echinata]|uniref:glutamate receptor 2-like n=1 Tax=Saccostrea echinata TaxID=191078 RepID=UPI002A80787B|nr:glutamate receptor 2-like [Saccostrea echinata]